MSLFGLIASATVIYEWSILHTTPPFCTLSNAPIINCAAVFSSPHSNLAIGPFTFSLEYLAALWFIVDIALVATVVFARKDTARKTFKALFAWRFLGIVMVPYLVYLELFQIKAICLYCTVMHIAIIADFVVITYLVFSPRSSIRRDLTG